MDLRGTEVERQIHKMLRPLARGNGGKVRITELALDGTKVVFGADIHHKHKPTSFITAYSVHTPVNGTVDLLNPANTEICIETPVGKACASVNGLQLKSIIGNLNIPVPV